jgi:putative ATP-dependent endonuclease of OLD family
MGTGEQQILALSLAYSYASAFHEGMLLVIEEPESHLHPLAQQWLARRLNAMAHDGLQIIVTTHSSHFVNLLSLPNLILVRKNSDGTYVKQLTTQQLVTECIRTGAPSSRTTIENILPFYAANATPEILEGFFASLIVLVEGRTEALALPELWRRLEFDHTQHGVAIIPVGGKGNLAKWKRLFEAYLIPCFIIFDNDARDDSNGIKRRDVLSAVSVPEVEHAELINSSDWVVGARYCIFGKNYERNLRELFHDYSSLEAASINQGVEAKPFVARWVAERLPLDPNNEGTKKLIATIKAIKALSPINEDCTSSPTSPLT